jgi:2',3'-cyclic-nucleotide 2'-phosphodiesterase (5'-nucleotidase family)
LNCDECRAHRLTGRAGPSGSTWPPPTGIAHGDQAAQTAAMLRLRCRQLLTIALAPWGLLPTAAAQQAPAANVVFLHWNDFHGQFRPQPAAWKVRPGLPATRAPTLGGAAALAGFVQRERDRASTAGQRVVVTDGGDWFQGTLEGNTTKGQLVVEFFSRLQLDAAVLGNHEFDFGADNVRALVAAAKFPVLGANVWRTGHVGRERVDYVTPFVKVEVHGLVLVLVGLLTADTKAVSTGPWGDATFGDEIAAVRSVLPAAERAGDVVVLLSHCGVETDRALARAFPTIPLILGGHSHTGLAAPLREGDTWIVQTHGKASEVYRLRAHADAGQRRLRLLDGELVELDPREHPDDAATLAWFTAATRELAATWDRVVGTLEVPPYEDRSARSSPLGNLVADSFRRAAGTELAFTNKGGLRTHLTAGPVTARQLFELLPFDNTLVSLTLTGAEVRQVLQRSLGKDRRPLEISGGSYRYTERDGNRELLDVTIDGRPLEPSRDYRIATSSFLARGGDGQTTFAAGRRVVDHGVVLHEVLIQRAEREPTLRADPANRIEFVARPQ